MDEKEEGRRLPVTRRSFIKGAGAGIAGAAVLGGAAAVVDPAQEAEAQGGVQTMGPGPVKLTLNINGTNRMVEVEPRTTLVIVLRGVGHTPLPPEQALT